MRGRTGTSERIPVTVVEDHHMISLDQSLCQPRADESGATSEQYTCALDHDSGLRHRQIELDCTQRAVRTHPK
jgi:hypothetical protein